MFFLYSLEECLQPLSGDDCLLRSRPLLALTIREKDALKVPPDGRSAELISRAWRLITPVSLMSLMSGL